MSLILELRPHRIEDHVLALTDYLAEGLHRRQVTVISPRGDTSTACFQIDRALPHGETIPRLWQRAVDDMATCADSTTGHTGPMRDSDAPGAVSPARFTSPGKVGAAL